MIFDARIPEGPLEKKWDNYKNKINPVSPNNKRKYNIIVVGTGLAGASAASSLGELGYNISCFCFQDSPRRAHSIAAQGGINSAKNYKNDGDSVYRLFYDTIKGGDFRAREANVYRLAQVSPLIIDHCVAQGVPFAREYGGLLDNRSFGGALVSRTFYAKGQTGQQLLLGAYGALNRQIKNGMVSMYPRMEMMDLILMGGSARGIVVRNLITGNISTHIADAVILASGGYGSIFYLSTNAINCNVGAIYQSYKKGALLANPCYTQIHPTCIPISGSYQSKLTLMSESLRNDGRVWVPQRKQVRVINVKTFPENERDYYLERKYPSYGNLAPRDIASRAAKQVCDEGRGVGISKLGVYLDFSQAFKKFGEKTMIARYGNLFQMYEKITGEDPKNVPMRIYPASHYTMGGLWVDYELMSTIPGLFVLGEANFSDHGANRLGASALMQGLADGYFILPYTINRYLNSIILQEFSIDEVICKIAIEKVKKRINSLMLIRGTKSPDYFHKKLGAVMWKYCGMTRNNDGLRIAMDKISKIKQEFDSDLRIPGSENEINLILDKALRVASFLEFAMVMCHDASERRESCGGHFREEYQTSKGEAKRNDKDYCHVQLWKFNGDLRKPILYHEKLTFNNIKLVERSYK